MSPCFFAVQLLFLVYYSLPPGHSCFDFNWCFISLPEYFRYFHPFDRPFGCAALSLFSATVAQLQFMTELTCSGLQLLNFACISVCVCMCVYFSAHMLACTVIGIDVSFTRTFVKVANDCCLQSISLLCQLRSYPSATLLRALTCNCCVSTFSSTVGPRCVLVIEYQCGLSEKLLFPSFNWTCRCVVVVVCASSIRCLLLSLQNSVANSIRFHSTALLLVFQRGVFQGVFTVHIYVSSNAFYAWITPLANVIPALAPTNLPQQLYIATFCISHQQKSLANMQLYVFLNICTYVCVCNGMFPCDKSTNGVNWVLVVVSLSTLAFKTTPVWSIRSYWSCFCCCWLQFSPFFLFSLMSWFIMCAFSALQVTEDFAFYRWIFASKRFAALIIVTVHFLFILSSHPLFSLKNLKSEHVSQHGAFLIRIHDASFPFLKFIVILYKSMNPFSAFGFLIVSPFFYLAYTSSNQIEVKCKEY